MDRPGVGYSFESRVLTGLYKGKFTTAKCRYSSQRPGASRERESTAYGMKSRRPFPIPFARIGGEVSLSVCVGDRLHSRVYVLPILQRPAADILMPDIERCGGISDLGEHPNFTPEWVETFPVPRHAGGPDANYVLI